MRALRRGFPVLLAVVAAAALVAVPVAGLPVQEATGAPAGSGLGRPYWHVFVAYVIAWALVLGWVVSIARRLARIEKRLEE